MTKEAMTLALEAYLCREMPAGTVIGDPKWWVPKIANAIKEALNHIPDAKKMVAQPEKTVCPFCSTEWVTAEQHDRKMDRMEQERCVGCEACIDTACGRDECPKGWPKAVQPEQEPVAWKLVPIEPTREMLEAMDECSIEGYDEHLYAGHAASVYMAAVDVAPSPPQPKEPEPVVWMYQDKSTHEVRFQKHMRGFVDHGATYETPLYTTPPQRTEQEQQIETLKRCLFQMQEAAKDLVEQAKSLPPPQRKPLTDEEIERIWESLPFCNGAWETFARAIEVAHGIKE